jgi:hypothetical protein
MADSSSVNIPATLVQQYTGRLLDISSVGCVIEILAPLHLGAVGRLEATIDGAIHVEAVRVARVDVAPTQGGATHVGLEFLVVTPAGAGSIRAAILRLIEGAAPLVTFVR